MKIVNKCVCCDSTDLFFSPAVVMPFITYRVFGWKPVEIDASWELKDIQNTINYQCCNTLECTNCGHLFMDIRFDDDELNKLYHEYRNDQYVKDRELFEPGYKKINEILTKGYKYQHVIENYLKTFLDNDLKILDFGGDTGINTVFLEDKEAEIYIYDISNKDTIDNITRIDTKDKLYNHKFNLIVCSQVLEHIPFPQKIVKDIYNISDKNTIVYFEVPYEVLMNSNKKEKYISKKHWHEHINFFSKNSLKKLCENEGFQILDMREFKIDVAYNKKADILGIVCKKKSNEKKDIFSEKLLKENVLKEVSKYYNLIHKPNKDKEFIAGKCRVNYAGRVYDEKEMLNLVDSSLDFWLTYGKYSKIFEKKLAEYLNIRWSFLVNSGSSANLLAFYSLTSPLLNERQIKRGDEVITVAAAFPTTVAPIIQYGAVPVFVDVELKNFNIDINELQKALTSKTKAIMIAHTLGNPFDLKRVKEFCDEHNLWLVEDNCDALGSKYQGKFTGTWGDLGTSSFYPPHHMTMGEGGAVYTDNPQLKKILLSMRDWGRDCWCESGVDNTCGSRFSKSFGTLPKGYDHKYVYSHFGFNLKATDMQAAIGVAQLDKLDIFIEKRKENYNKLFAALCTVNEITLMHKQFDSEPSWFGFLMTIKENSIYKRNEFAEYLEKNNIQTRNLFAGNILKHPLFDSLHEDKDYRVIGNLDNTNRIMNDSLWIGLYPEMKVEALEYMILKITSYFE